MSLKVFISYAKENSEHASRFYELLTQEGASPWMDEKKLLPGQNWEAEIEKAFNDANVILLLLSSKSVSKRGFVQREANDAIERLRYKQPTDIYVIPLLLEPCDVPTHIAGRLQYVDINTPGSWEQIKASLKLAAAQQSIELEKGVNLGKFQMFTKIIEDEWVGRPGHDIKIDYPVFTSTERPELANELTLFFSGRAATAVLEMRQKPWIQSPDYFSSDDEYRATNGRWDGFGVTHSTNNFLSITYDVGWYGAGAAHPNSNFETYNFLLLEKLYLLNLEDFFEDFDAAIERISDLCVKALCREYWSRMGEKPDEQQIEWFNQGAGADSSNFKAFTISEDKFTFLFPPYQVGPYALGRWSADVSFYDLLDVLRSDGPHIQAAITPYFIG